MNERVFLLIWTWLFVSAAPCLSADRPSHPTPRTSTPTARLAANAPYPPKGAGPALHRWLSQNTHIHPSEVFALTSDVVFAELPTRPIGAHASDATSEHTVVIEADVVRPSYTRIFLGRSAKMIITVDCALRRMKSVSLKTFSEPGLKGQAKTQGLQGLWIDPPAQSALDALVRRTCDADFVGPFGTTR